MVVDREKTVRLLKEAILQLCRVSLMGSFEVDGIICISPNNTEEERQLVIKVHEQVSEESVNGQDTARDKRKQRDVHRNKTMFALKSNNELEDSVETTNETASPWKNSGGSDASSWVSDFSGCISGNSWKKVDRMLKMQPASNQRHRALSHNHEEEIQELSIKKTVRKIEDSFYFACKLCAMAFASKLALDSHVEQCSQKNSRNDCGDHLQFEEREGRTFQRRITRKRKQQKPLKGFKDVIDPNNANVKIISCNFLPSNDSIPKTKFHSNTIPSTDELLPVEREAVNPLVSDLFHSPENVATTSEQKSDGTTATSIKSEGSCLCQMCGVEFSDFASCSFHYKTVHNVYACAYCQEKFSDEQMLEEHLAVHAEQELSDCLLCGLTLMRRSALFAHHQQVHGLELESNGLPNSGDLVESFVEKDVADVAGEERIFPKLEEFGCREKMDSSVNNVGFESGNQLLRPQNRSSHGIGSSNFVSKRLLGWSAFNPKFQRPLDRRDWPSLGDDEKVYECDKCRELIQGTGVYQLHCKKLHRRTPCLHCGKTFSQKGNMERHMRLHTGVKPYRCHLCRRSFCRKEALLGHVGQDHSTSLRSSL